MDEEIFKSIPGYDGMYEVSNYGRVKSLKRKIHKFLKPAANHAWYLFVALSKDGKVKQYKVHRLVAQAFIKNPNNLPCVNHIDENKTNNNVNNLEWCTYKYNNNDGTKKIRQGEKSKNENNPNSHRILCVNTGEIFECVKFAAEKYNISRQTISHCLNGRQKTAGKDPVTKEKLIWRYYEG